MSIIKKEYQIHKIRILSKLAALSLEYIKKYIKIGVSTEYLNNILNNYIINDLQCESAILNYQKFPKSICTSVNDVACHGIPSNKLILKDGDLINIDVTLKKDGYYSDTSKMFFVGKISDINKNLCLIAKNSLYLAISLIKEGLLLKDLGKIIETYVNKNHFYVAKGYCGHGVGLAVHEEPYVFHHKVKNYNVSLKRNMIITVEPIINIGTDKTYLDKDGWSVRTINNHCSAQYEHTILVKKTGCEVLTLRANETIDKILNN